MVNPFAIPGTITALKLFNQPNRLMILYKGMEIASKGIMKDTIVSVNNNLLPGKSSLANANPAIELSSTPNTTTVTATYAVFSSPLGYPVSVNNATYASRVGGMG